MNEINYRFPLRSWECHTPDMVFLNCQGCALEFAKEHNLDIRNGLHHFSDESNGFSVSECYACGHEADYPAACDGCGEYLDIRLTEEGKQYLLERGDFPEWLVRYYLGEEGIRKNKRLREAESSDHQVFSNGALVGYHTRLGGLYVCIQCGHNCECQEEEGTK